MNDVVHVCVLSAIWILSVNKHNSFVIRVINLTCACPVRHVALCALYVSVCALGDDFNYKSFAFLYLCSPECREEIADL